MKIMIAVPCMDTAPIRFMESITAMDKPRDTAICFHPGSLIYDARNLLSLQAIQAGYDYVMWIDSDITCQRDAMTHLLDVSCGSGAPLVSGLYVTRSENPKPVIFDVVKPPEQDENGHIVKRIHNYTDYPRDSVFPIQGCGFGFVLTSVPLLKRVWDKFGPAFTPLMWTGEDVAFCHRVNLLGETMLCDSRVKLGHVGMFEFTEKMLRYGGDGR